MIEKIASPETVYFEEAWKGGDPVSAMNELLALWVERMVFNSIKAAVDENPEGTASRLILPPLGNNAIALRQSLVSSPPWIVLAKG